MNHRPFDVIVHPSGPLGGYVAAPPSKNYTARLILGAAMAEGQSFIHRPAANDDARALVRCLRAMGARIDERGGDLEVIGFAGDPKNPGRLNPGNAGAVLRFLLGTACLVEGEVVFETDYKDSLGRRPNAELLAALRQLGAGAEGADEEGRLPIRIAGGRSRVHGGPVRISGARSSQFLSSLLLLAPYLEGVTEITLGEEDPARPPVLVSRAPVEQTLETMGEYNLALQADFTRLRFFVPGGQCGTGGGDVVVGGDWPSGAALLAAVAVAGGMATLEGLETDAQGERRAEDCLRAMGCRFERPHQGKLMIHSKGELLATEFDGDLATDAVLALVGAACLARGTSRFYNVGNLKLKECDRIREPLEELAKLGVEARAGADWIEVTGRPEGYEGGVTVDSRGDHRVAQLLAIVGTRCARGLTITRAEHIAKSYPDFFEDLEWLGVHLEVVPVAAR